MPDQSITTFQNDSKQLALGTVPHFLMALMRNRKIDLQKCQIMDKLQSLTITIAKLYYETE